MSQTVGTNGVWLVVNAKRFFRTLVGILAGFFFGILQASGPRRTQSDRLNSIKLRLYRESNKFAPVSLVIPTRPAASFCRLNASAIVCQSHWLKERPENSRKIGSGNLLPLCSKY